MVSVPKGKVYDVIVDLRPESPTFKKWEGYELSDKNHKALYVPRGFAHGFVVTSEEVLFNYKCTDFYASEYDSGLL